jgi:group I intron endonuclease
VCGIYKITDLITKQVYIGQSVDISRRWKDHIRYGLGINAPSTNALYKAMKKDGITEFTF